MPRPSFSYITAEKSKLSQICSPNSSTLFGRSISNERGNSYGPRIDMTKVRGLAMIPEKKHPSKDGKYGEKTVAKALEPPCPISCQKLVRQMGTDWKTVFDVDALKTECGV